MSTRVVLVAGNTRTAEIEGISAAGKTPALMAHTPGADLEIVCYGEPLGRSVLPVSPSGCPTPAVITRAIRELLGFEILTIDAGLARETGAPTVQLGDNMGEDIRHPKPVPEAGELFERAREFGRSLPEDRLIIGETIPGGTTTALGVLTALGERESVSSSLQENPLQHKRELVDEALTASGLDPGGAAGDPIQAVQRAGDPVLVTVAGLVAGSTATDSTVTLAGGTQMAAAGALVRHAGIQDPVALATTSFIADDKSADIAALAADLSLDLTVTDPGFDRADHPAMARYAAGEAKEGVGMGGALALFERSDRTMRALHDQIETVYGRLRPLEQS